jgi:hypothetical protein
MVENLARRRRRALADRGDGLAARGDEAVAEDGSLGQDVAHEHTVEWLRHLY